MKKEERKFESARQPRSFRSVVHKADTCSAFFLSFFLFFFLSFFLHVSVSRFAHARVFNICGKIDSIRVPSPFQPGPSELLPPPLLRAPDAVLLARKESERRVAVAAGFRSAQLSCAILPFFSPSWPLFKFCKCRRFSPSKLKSPCLLAAAKRVLPALLIIRAPLPLSLWLQYQSWQCGYRNQ